MAGRIQKDSQEALSYADYQKWPVDERFEIKPRAKTGNKIKREK